MATFQIRWLVTDPDAYLVTYDEMRVWRAPASTGPWVEITGVGTRVVLVTGTTAYSYTDGAGSAGDQYAYDFHASATGDSTPLVTPQWYGEGGYCSVAELREEGLPLTVSDDRAAVGILRATNTIDRVTRQFFAPRDRTFIVDANSGRDLLLNIPIIAVTSVAITTESLSLADLVVYNRHLTQGLDNPDDRDNPRIAWREFDYPSGIGTLERGARRWFPGRQRVTVSGIFGYTDLANNVVPGETSPGSQVPASYGQTPEPIKYCCLRLAMRFAYPMAGGLGDDIRNQRRLTGESTRDQSYTLANPGVWSSSWGATGDEEVDDILSGFLAPFSCGVV